mmetsp:Transcript_66909/g.105885  ORF Transcript_66909/g.105885 Transcript_66909/m.105885 type:complete len:371 (-) Transcript_66909:139-1251(-)
MTTMAVESSALTSLTPVTPLKPLKDDYDDRIVVADDLAREMRANLTRPPDQENDLIQVAALHGPAGILAVMRARRDYSWFVTLGFRAIEVCLGPRNPKSLPVLRECDPVAFAMQMLEMEMIDEIFLLQQEFEAIEDVQRVALAIMELLIMDDPEWRDEVARKGGVRLLCDLSKIYKDRPNIMCLILTCMSYLAAEDYIEIMLGQHDALEYVTYVLRNNAKHIELATRASLALLNLTVCESHVEELADKGGVQVVLQVLDMYPKDVHIAIIICGVLANLSVSDDVRTLLVDNGVFQRLANTMKLDPQNAVLQVACIKALVNYSMSGSDYLKLEEVGIPDLVGRAQLNHPGDVGVRKYGDYFFGQHTSCPIL